MSDVSLEGPVTLVNGELVLRVPLSAGGGSLAPFVGTVGKVEGEDLVVVIQPWLAKKLRIGAGSLVIVDNLEGKFRITRSEANDEGSAVGPVELVNGEWVLRIPLSAGGEQLAPVAGEMGTVEAEYLIVRIPPSLAEELQIVAGSQVVVDNLNGKFTITRSAANDALGTQSV